MMQKQTRRGCLPKSGLRWHLCSECGRKFICAEHCGALWRARQCTCHLCEEKKLRTLSGRVFAEKCKVSFLDEIIEWIKIRGRP